MLNRKKISEENFIYLFSFIVSVEKLHNRRCFQLAKNIFDLINIKNDFGI